VTVEARNGVAVDGSLGVPVEARPDQPPTGRRVDREFRSYYGQPILKVPVWRPSIPLYFFVCGLAGASGALAFAARVLGHRRLARGATFAALAGVAASPPLLIEDLGRPARFYNMLRVFKVTSPMSVGTWVLTAFGAAIGVAGSCELFGVLPRIKLVAQALGGLLGLPLATYTGALIADTAVPTWHEARRELPFVFAGGAAASAGGLAAIVTPAAEAGPARRLAVLGGVLEIAAVQAMERQLGPLLAEPYRRGPVGRLTRFAELAAAGGTTLLALGGRRRAPAVVGGALLLVGALAERFAVFEAGLASARDPKYTVVPQRERVEQRMEAARRP